MEIIAAFVGVSFDVWKFWDKFAVLFLGKEMLSPRIRTHLSSIANIIACRTKIRRFCIIRTHTESKLCAMYVSLYSSFPPYCSSSSSVSVHLFDTHTHTVLFLAQDLALSLSHIFVHLRARTSRIWFVHRAVSIARCLMCTVYCVLCAMCNR